MALNAAIVWEVRTTGNDGNGGGFKSTASGTDRTLQDAAHATLTAASVVHTTTTQINVAVGDFTVSAADIGNLLQVTGGTATAGFYEITNADVPNNRWTVDRAVGTAGQTVVGAMGGAVASPAKVGAAAITGHTVFIKAGTYVMSVNTANVANGKWSVNALVLVIGYDTTRAWGNTDTKPLLQASVALGTMWAGSNNWVYNIAFDAASKAATSHVTNGAYTRCSFVNSTAADSMTFASHCTATTNAANVFVGSGFFYCEAWANTATPFAVSNGTLGHCLAYDNTGAATDGFTVASIASGHFFNCIAVNNGRDGFRGGASNSRMILQNCIAEDNAGWGVNSVSFPSIVIRCAFFSNTSGTVTGAKTEVASITATASVFTNAAAGDFSLNNTAGAGADLRAVGYIDLSGATFPRGLTTSYLDVGIAQHQDAGGATVYVPIQTTTVQPIRTSVVGY
jgi:hypothetical protein